MSESPLPVRRVVVTRDESPDGPLARALRARGFEPCACPVLLAQPPAELARLTEAARLIDRYDLVVAASARSVQAITAAGASAWRRAAATAAVGTATARALQEAGVTRPVLTPADDGADALWDLLASRPWRDHTVLVLTTPGGRTLLADRLRAAGARVHEVEAYRMTPRPPDAIAADWAAAAADHAVVASPRVAMALASAIGVEALRRVAVVAIGDTTAAALTALGVPSTVAPAASFECVASCIAHGAGASA